MPETSLPVRPLDDSVSAFIRAACVPHVVSHTSGTLDEAEAILAGHPQVARANIHTAAILADESAVKEFLALDPSSSTATGGPYDWDALTHLCFSRYLRLDPARSDAFVRAARALLDAGASANTGWYEQPHRPGDKPVFESVLYGAAGAAHHPGLTRLLLEYGADPNDGETPYHAPESYDNTVLQILLESNKVNALGKSWILARKADWHDHDGMKLALDHGADPNIVPHWGNTALEHSIQRDNAIEMIQLLLDRGADPLRVNFHLGLNAAARAARRGRADVLALLAQRGIDPQLRGVDRLIAACAQADSAAIQSLLAGAPGPDSGVPGDGSSSPGRSGTWDGNALHSQLLALGGTLLPQFAGNGNTEGVRCLLELGVPVDALYDGDPYFEIARGSIALHVAAWRARPDTSKLLIERGAPINALDGKGRTPLQLAVRACVDSYWKNRRSPEWVKPLLDAGASLQGIEIPCGYDEADELLLRAANPK